MRQRLLWNRLFSSAGKILSEDFWRYTLPVLAASLVWGIAYVLYSVIMGHMGADCCMTGVFQQDQIDLRDTAEYVGECNSA